MERLGVKRSQVAVLLLPGLVVFGLFTIYPVLKLLYMSFFDWHLGEQASVFTGLANFKEVLTDPQFGTALKNTLLYGLVTIPGQLLIGLVIAVLIQGLNRFQLPYKVGFYLPVIASWVIVSLIFRYLFNNEGYLNYILKDVLRLTDANIKWMSKSSSAFFVIELLGIWKGIGWNMVIFLAALQTVPPELYEAANMDGCGRFKSFLYVTLPSIRNTILFALVMLTIGAFNVFPSVQLITGGGPAFQTEVVLTWMYYKAFGTGNFGYAAALSYIIAMIVTVFTVLQFGLFNTDRKGA